MTESRSDAVDNVRVGVIRDAAGGTDIVDVWWCVM